MIKSRPALRGASRVLDEKNAPFVTVVPDLLVTLIVGQTFERVCGLIVPGCGGLSHLVFGIESDSLGPLLKLRILVVLIVRKLAPQDALINSNCFNRRA